MLDYVFKTKKPTETAQFGQFVARFLFPQSVIALSGDLGAGKTTFAGGIAQGLGIHEKIISPTFNIMRCYFHAKLPLFHIDAYRLESGNKELGLEEFVEGNGVTLIEWPQYIADIVPVDSLNIRITNLGDDLRQIHVQTNNSRFEEMFAQMKEAYPW